MDPIIKEFGTAFGIDSVYILAALLATLAYKYFKKIHTQYKRQKTENLIHLKEYTKSNSKDKLIEELLFLNFLGKLISKHEIDFFKQHPETARNIFSFIAAKEFLTVSQDSTKITLKHYTHIKSWVYLMLYFLTAFSGLIFVLYSYIIFTESLEAEAFSAWSLIALSLIFLAGLFLNQSANAQEAIRLHKRIKEYKQSLKEDQSE